MSKEIELPRGFRDFSPNDKILRDKIQEKIKKVFESYGFLPLQTPTIERKETLNIKDNAGDSSDIVSELYEFKDQGNRDLVLRYELTFQLARYVVLNPDLKMPFKRYQFGNVFRDGPIKLGRYREFTQCDADIVGVDSVIADSEIISIVDSIFKELDLDVNIFVNSRLLLEDIFKSLDIDPKLFKTIIITIDKLAKLGIDKVKQELQEKNIDSEKINKILDFFDVDGDNIQKLNKIESMLSKTEGVSQLRALFGYLDAQNIKYTFLPSLARGLGYYTGPIFEVNYKDKEIISSSLCGGGRWDNMISKYTDSKVNYSATGVGVGFEPIYDLLKKLNRKFEDTIKKIYLIPINTQKEVLKISNDLRKQGIITEIDLKNRKIPKNFEYAEKKGYNFVGIIGENEIKDKTISIKNIVSGKKDVIKINEVKDYL